MPRKPSLDQISVSPGPRNTLIDEYGKQITPPSDWDFLPAGDAGVTRRVTSKGKFWRVSIKKGKRTVSKGIWAPSATIQRACKEMAELRNSENYKRKLDSQRQKRNEKQLEFIGDFMHTVRKFLNFDQKYTEVERVMAIAISKHATPVGSGTVARSSNLTISEKASKATIAWMRHQTTAYDHMIIPKAKGARREVRKLLAHKSIELLANYRNGKPIKEGCPLMKAVMKHIQASQ